MNTNSLQIYDPLQSSQNLTAAPIHVFRETSPQGIDEDSAKFQLKIHGELPLDFSSQARCSTIKWFTGAQMYEALRCASKSGMESTLKLLRVVGNDLKFLDNDGHTPLLLSAANVHKAVVKLLLEKSADVGYKDNDGHTPLSWAAWTEQEAVLKLLLEKAIDLGSEDNSGRTPLSWAAELGHEEVVKLLLEKGADLYSKESEYGQTPLSWAAKNGHEKVVKLLLEKSVDIDSKDLWDQYTSKKKVPSEIRLPTAGKQ